MCHARQAVSDLSQQGFSRDDVSLVAHAPEEEYSRYFDSTANTPRPLPRAPTPARHGHKTVANRADQAASVVQAHGPVDVEQRVASWRQAGRKRFDSQAAPYTTDQIAAERAAARRWARQFSGWARRRAPSWADSQERPGATFPRPVRVWRLLPARV